MAYNIRFAYVDTEAEYNAMVEDGNINENYFYYVKDTGATYRGTTPLTDSVIVIEDVKTIPENPVANRFYIDMNGGLAILLDNHWVVVNDPEVKAVNFVDDASEQPSGAEEGVLYFDGSNLGTLVGANWMMLNDLAVSGLTLVNDVTTTPSELTDNHLYADLQGGLAFAARKDDDTVVYTLLIDPTYKSLQQVATVAIAPDGARFGTLYCDPEGHLAYMSRVADDNGNYPWIQVQAKEAEYSYKAFQIASLLTVERGKKYDYGNVRLAEEIPSGMFLTCVGSGVSADATPDSLNKKVKAGEVVEDGTVKWKICKFASTEDVANLQKVPEADHATTADKATDADKLDGIPANLYATKADYADYTDNFQRIDDKVVALTEKVDAFDETYVNNEKLNGYLQQATEAYTALTNRDDELKSDIDTKANKADFDNAIKQATTVYNQLTAKDKELQANIDKKVDTTTYQAAIDELDDRVTTLNASVADVIDSNTEINASLENKVDKDEYNQAIQQATTTITSMLTDITNLKNTDSQFEDAYNQFNASVTQQFQEINTKHDDLANKVQDNWNGHQEAIVNTNTRLDQTVSRVDVLESGYTSIVENGQQLAQSFTDQIKEINTKHDDLANKVQDNWDGHQASIDGLNTRVGNLETQGTQALQQVQTELQKLTKADQDLSKSIEDKINALIWKPAVDNQVAMVALAAPQEGWTVSLKDTNKVYRFDADYSGAFDEQHIAAGDGTPGAWVELGHAIYSLATQTADGLMSAADKKILDEVPKTYETIANVGNIKKELEGKIDALENKEDGAVTDAIETAKSYTDSAVKTVANRVETVEGYFEEGGTGKAKVALNAEQLGGKAPAEYAAASDLTTLTQKVNGIDTSISGEDGIGSRLTTAEADIDKVEGYFDESGAAKKANELVDFDKADYYTKTEADKAFVKVEEGKGLSKNDFSDEYKGKLDSLDTTIGAAKQEAITHANNLNTAMDTRMQAVEGKFNEEGKALKAVDADTLGGIAAAEYATAESVEEVLEDTTNLKERVTTAEGEIDTLQGYFTEGKAKEALNATTLGGNAVDYFATKSALDTQGETVADNAADIAELQGYFEGGVALNAKALDGHEASYFAIGTDVETIKGYFTDGKANTALKLDGFDQNLYLLKTEAAGTYITPEAVDTKLADYAKSTDVSSQITGAISGLQWKTSVADITALKAIEIPQEGWTVSVDDTNAIYRYDAQCVEAGDDDKYVKANDATAGAWVKLSTSFYSVATASTDGLMSSTDKNKLDAFANASDYLKSTEAATTYLGIHATADNAAKLNDQDASFYAKASDLNAEVVARTTTDGKVSALEGYFTGDVANKANELVGFNPAKYATTEAMNTAISTATTDMATNDSVDGKLAKYATTEAMNDALDGKVDKVVGKQLSTEDFTTEFKTAVETLDTTYQPIGDYVTNDALTGKGYAVDSEVKATYATKTELAAKADASALAKYATTEAMTTAISTATKDMATNAGVDGKLADYATTEAMNKALADKVDVVAGKQLSTEDFTTAFKTAVENLATTYQPIGNYVTDEALTGKGYVVESEVASKYATKDELATKADGSALANYVQKDELDTAIGDMATKTEVAETYATKVVLNTVDGTVVALQEQIALLKQQIQNLKTPDVETVTVEADVTQEDKDVKVASAEVTDTTRTVKAKSIQVEDYKATNSRTVLSAANDVTINNLTTSGDLPKSTSNAGMSIYSNADVVINSGDWNQTGYNAIEIGLNTDTTPKNVLIDGIDFNAKMSNNAILIFAHQANATITISNCHFADVSNCVRISNRLNVPAKIKFINCTCDAWESRPGYELYPGFLILEDYTSKNETDFKEQNRFAKLDIEFINCYGPHGKLEGDASTLSVPGPEQAVYICVDNWNSTVLTYEGNEQYFPKISAI